MTNVVTTLWRSVYARGFFFHLLYQKNENCTLRQKLLKHTWYAYN